MTRLYLVRHGRAAAGWGSAADPGLDAVGRAQAAAMTERIAPLGPLDLVTSPLLRCQETAAGLAHAWGTTARIESGVAEIPSPAGIESAARVEWLRLAMAGTWAALGPHYTAFRDGVASTLLGLPRDTVVASHFIAINVAIGVACGDDRVVVRHLDNCSVTVLDVVDGMFQLVEGGQEADTLIR